MKVERCVRVIKEHKIETEVLEILSDCCVDATGRKLKLPDIVLARPLYMSVNKILEAMGGKWDKKPKSHIFAYPVEDALEFVINTGTIQINPSAKQELQAFYTPDGLAERVVMEAGIHTKPGCVVLEPSAGEGALVIQALTKGAGRIDCIDVIPGFGDKIIQRIARSFSATEAAPEASHNGAYIERKNSKDDFKVTFEVRDFLTLRPEHMYSLADFVIMNPPFARGQEVDHVTHALRFLKPTGTLVAIMSAGVMFRQDKRYKEFRNLITVHGGFMTTLPEKSFADSGTNVNTVMVKMFCGER